MSSLTRVSTALAVASTALLGGGAFQDAAAASVQTVTATADTYVRYDAPTTNYGTSVRWSVEGRTNIWRNALIRFNVTVPAGEEVVSARLRAYSEATASATDFVDVYATPGGWMETGVTWQTAPARGAWLDKVGGFLVDTWVEWDVTAGVPKSGGEANFKLESNAPLWLGFKSREHTDAALRPQLVVETAPVTPPPPGGDVTLAAVGDMNPDGNTSTSSSSGRNAAAIIAGLNSGSLDAFIGIGDFQYNKGYCADLVNEWSRLWGAAIPKTYWTAGPNHDVEPGVNDDLDRFMNGQCPGSSAVSATNAARGGFVDALDFYSFDLGAWHIAVLPTATWRYDATRARALTATIDADLANAKAAGKHLAAVYHDPYFTSNTSSHTRFADVKPWVDVLWKHRVRLTLSGSQHNYERSCPVNNADQCVADGMTAFQVSTGGIGLRSFTSSPAYIVKRFSDTWGHLVLTLREDGSFAWEFKPVSGGMQTDSGSRAAN